MFSSSKSSIAKEKAVVNRKKTEKAPIPTAKAIYAIGKAIGTKGDGFKDSAKEELESNGGKLPSVPLYFENEELGELMRIPVEINADGTLRLTKRKIREIAELVYEENIKSDQETRIVFYGLLSNYLEQVDFEKDPDGYAMTTVDKLLELRGLEKKKGKDGYSSGYRPEQRAEMALHIKLLAGMYVSVAHMFYFDRGQKKKIVDESPLFEIRNIRHFLDADTREVHRIEIYYRPGEWLRRIIRESKQIGFINKKVFSLNPYKQGRAINLAFYHSFLERASQKDGGVVEVTVGKLAKEMGIDLDNARKKEEEVERFEKWMDFWFGSAWEYKTPFDESLRGQRGWIDEFKKCLVVITPDVDILEQYSKIKQYQKEKEKEPVQPSEIVEEIKKAIKKLGISINVAAEQIGIHRSTLSRILRQIQRPDDVTKRKFEKWLKEVNDQQ